MDLRRSLSVCWHFLHSVWDESFFLPKIIKMSMSFTFITFIVFTTVEPRFNEVAGEAPNLFVKWRVRYIENLDITNLRGNDQNVRYIEVIVND